jgi:SAM-dependent methyltransferase
MNKIKNWLYNLFLTKDTFPLSTPNLFYSVLQYIPNHSYIIDFGCGNGEYYTKTHITHLIKQKNLFILCIDIDTDAIEICKQNTKHIQQHTKVVSGDILLYKDSIKYDYLFFTESAPLMTNSFIIDVILYCKQTLLNKYHKIIFINNLNDNLLMKKIKPLLKYITTVDFGRTLTCNDFQTIQKKLKCNMKIFKLQSMKMYDILSYFYLSIFKLFFKNQNITQYMIIL